MKWIALIARIIVGSLFIFSGLIKLNDPVGTAIKLQEYFEVFAVDIAGFFLVFVPFALFFSVFLSVLEVVLGLAVLIWYRSNITTWVLLLLIIFFTFLTFYSAYFNKVTDCGCFGDAIKLTPWQSFTKDIILLLLILVLFFNKRIFTPLFSRRTGSILLVIFILINAGVGIYAIQYLPFIDFRAYKVGADIPALMHPSSPLRYQYIMTKGGETFTFENYPSDTSYHYKSMDLINPEAQAKITDYTIWNNEGDLTQESFSGAKLMIIIYDVHKADTEDMQEIKALVDKVGDDVEVWAITASGEKAFETFRHTYQLAIPYFYGDATVLKTIVRSNPGLLLMQDGVVKGKWSHNEVPDIAEVRGLLQ